MTQDESKVIEMQTYSMSYSYSAFPPGGLPYQWDPAYQPEVDEPIQFLDEPLVNYKDQPFPDADLLCDPAPMVCGEEKSQISESSNTLSTDTPNKNEVPVIYKQLDFILNSLRRQKKVPTKKPAQDKIGRAHV